MEERRGPFAAWSDGIGGMGRSGRGGPLVLVSCGGVGGLGGWGPTERSRRCVACAVCSAWSGKGGPGPGRQGPRAVADRACWDDECRARCALVCWQAMEAVLATGGLKKLSVKILFEGEEEVLSPFLSE